MTQRIAVLGGGVSGLTAAWNLISRSTVGSVEVVLCEGSSRVGGWMKSVTTSQGAVFECGPRSLRVAGRSADTTMKLVSLINYVLDCSSTVDFVVSLRLLRYKRIVRVQSRGPTLN